MPDPRLARLLLFVAVLVAVGSLGFSVFEVARRPPADPPPRPADTLRLPAPAPDVYLHHELQRGDTLGEVLAGYGLDARAIQQAALPVYDLTRVRAGRALTLVTPARGDAVTELRYPLSEDETLVVRRDGAGWTASKDTVHYTATPVVRRFEVTRSLWQSAVDAGLRPGDILAIAKVFESDVDFNTEIQQGDRVELVVDEQRRDDGFTRLGPPLALRLHRGDKVLSATRFQAPGAKAPAYWDEEALNRRGAFLRSPLEFSRVTSGFSTGRFHPVLKRNRPHYGVDFGAPTGTPVRAVASGKVVRAGRAGGHGNFVKLDHEGPYETSYSHLSRIDVRQGQQVEQGQVIGAVGMTGLATGPHLHYQLWVGGKYRDPLKTELPRNEALPADVRAAFQERRALLGRILDGELPPSVLAPAAPPATTAPDSSPSAPAPAPGDAG